MLTGKDLVSVGKITGKPMSRYAMAGVQYDGASMAATDGRRMLRVTNASERHAATMLAPPKSLPGADKSRGLTMLGEPEADGVTRYVAKIGATRVADVIGDFPDVDRIMPKPGANGYSKIMEVNPRMLGELLLAMADMIEARTDKHKVYSVELYAKDADSPLLIVAEAGKGEEHARLEGLQMPITSS